MDFDFTPEQRLFREEVDDFVRKELPPDWDDEVVGWPGAYGTSPLTKEHLRDFCRGFIRKMGKRGWLTASWPVEHGGMNSMMKQAIVDEVASYHRVPSGDVATYISGPTIIMVGNEEMKKEWLPRIAAGEVSFWLGYSEPNAGSDLASLETRAVDEGDCYVLNGQKTWSSVAHIADYGWVLARTDPSAPKHKGATLMIVESGSPGVTIRPIVNICGHHSFNEVFFENVRVPKQHVVGESNQGFYNVMLALQYERIIVGVGAFRRFLEDLVRYVKEAVHDGQRLAENPFVRNKVASLAIEVEVLYGTYWRMVWMMDRGQISELEASGLKLFASELGRRLATTAVDILGVYGQLESGSPHAPLNGRVSLGYLDSISGPIGAGTSEIQRTIIATRGLGLPRK
jgi:alkylation response protein AidB-like acyl-CoA dehydrogenase